MCLAKITYCTIIYHDKKVWQYNTSSHSTKLYCVYCAHCSHQHHQHQKERRETAAWVSVIICGSINDHSQRNNCYVKTKLCSKMTILILVSIMKQRLPTMIPYNCITIFLLRANKMLYWYHHHWRTSQRNSVKKNYWRKHALQWIK